MSQEDQDQEDLAAKWLDELNVNDAAPEGAAPPDAAFDPLAEPLANDAANDLGQAAGSASDDEALAAQWAEELAKDEERQGPATFGGPASGAGGSVQGGSLGAQALDAHFQDMTDMSRQHKDNKLKRELDFILDIPLDVSAELGRTRLLINELLQLGQGSVVELNKLAGEPLEVYVNGKLVARGEAVVINEKFGVRLTDIISPIERVKQLG